MLNMSRLKREISKTFFPVQTRKDCVWLLRPITRAGKLLQARRMEFGIVMTYEFATFFMHRYCLSRIENNTFMCSFKIKDSELRYEQWNPSTTLIKHAVNPCTTNMLLRLCTTILKNKVQRQSFAGAEQTLSRTPAAVIAGSISISICSIHDQGRHLGTHSNAASQGFDYE